VIWPVEPVPTARLSVETRSVPGDAIVPPAPVVAGCAGALFWVTGGLAGGSGWVAAVIMTWPWPAAVLASGGGVESRGWVQSRGRDDGADSVPDGPEDVTAPALPRSDGPCGAGPVRQPAAMVGMISRTAAGLPADPARTKAEAITAAEAMAPAPASSTPALGTRRGRRAACGGSWTRAAAGGSDRTGNPDSARTDVRLTANSR